MSVNSNLEENESLVYFIGTLDIKRKRLKSPIHLSNYWWAGISNYVYNNLSVITKMYIFLLYFSLVLLSITQSEPTLITWTVTSRAVFKILYITRNMNLWIRCIVFIWYDLSLPLWDMTIYLIFNLKKVNNT